MKQTLRDGDTLARLGGDEFVAILVDLRGPAESHQVLERLLASTAEVIHADGQELRVSASMGVAFYPQASDIDPDHLLRQADLAMYQAKKAGKGRYHLYVE